MNNTLLVGISVTGVALLICIISTAIPYWWVSEYANIGLFRSCVTIKGLFNVPPIESCGETNGKDWVKATRAMMILSILALGASLLLSVLFGFIMKDKQILAIGSAFMCFAAAGFALLGVIIFGAKASEVFESAVGTLHAGFGLAIVALIAAALAGSLIFLARTKN